MEERKKIEEIDDAIQLLRDQIEDFKELKDELRQKRKAAGLQREQEYEQLRKRQRGD
jgi:FtsZ-binding cell division protein ZapB